LFVSGQWRLMEGGIQEKVQIRMLSFINTTEGKASPMGGGGGGKPRKEKLRLIFLLN